MVYISMLKDQELVNTRVKKFQILEGVDMNTEKWFIELRIITVSYTKALTFPSAGRSLTTHESMVIAKELAHFAELFDSVCLN